MNWNAVVAVTMSGAATPLWGSHWFIQVLKPSLLLLQKKNVFIHSLSLATLLVLMWGFYEYI